MIDWGKPTESNAVFVESTNAEELRAQRVWQFVKVLWFIWVFFTVFLKIRGYDDAATVCLVNSVSVSYTHLTLPTIYSV